MINAIGLQNMGVAAFIAEKLPALRRYSGTACIANVFGYTVDDYLAVIEQLNTAEGVAAYELNASCPNTRHGGLIFGGDPAQLAELVVRSKRLATRPLIVKLSPNVTSIAQMARVAEAAGADAISLVNTFVSLAIDVKTRRPRIANVTGGLSGPAIKPIAVRMVWEAARAVKDPGHRHGWNHHAGRRRRVPAGRSHSRGGRYRLLRGSARCREAGAGTRNLVQQQSCGAGERPDGRPSTEPSFRALKRERKKRRPADGWPS